MRLGQVKWNNAVVAAIFENGHARPIPDYNLYELICRSEQQGLPLTELAQRLAAPSRLENPQPLIPLTPREVWGAGCTYESSATFRDAEHGTREGFYAHAHRDERPELFFKGTGRMCVGPGQDIGIRVDSRFTAPEPELAVVLGARGKVIGYTIGNDVSAWDIERENPLYLPQSKSYTACCALGPVIVTAADIADPYKLHMTCTVRRGEQTTFSGETSTGALRRKIDTLIEFLLRANPVPTASVLLTGTGIIVPREAALAPGDVVTINVPDIGELSNPAATVK
ncbi:MAG TPA: fumarylacetoacetate hydrolase family protein [Bryobacteraceae bacterium]|jgi:2-dehydro-3-deoxy-D-arabinonate dehydratase|nr:fumarylacetoacetate hydrolase family protein [Bryobacteraceae bacterium]